MVNRGEVWWADLEEEGTRPVLVLTRQAAIAVLNKVLVSPATRTIRSIPTEVLLDVEDGTPEPCVLSFDNILTVSKALLTQRICILGPSRMLEVCRAWRDAVDC